MSDFQSLEVGERGSGTQPKVVENLNLLNIVFITLFLLAPVSPLITSC